MRCFVVAGFLLTSASRGPSAIAEPLVRSVFGRLHYGEIAVFRFIFVFYDTFLHFFITYFREI